MENKDLKEFPNKDSEVIEYIEEKKDNLIGFLVSFLNSAGDDGELSENKSITMFRSISIEQRKSSI